MIYLRESSNPSHLLSDMDNVDEVLPLPAWKRTLDLTFCFLCLPILGLMTLGAAIIMKLTSPGPIFFTQERVGLRGKRFKIYKFRSMKVSAETDSHQQHLKELIHSRAPMLKLDTKKDNRMIPGAKFLRATGLDELPQVINILRGEMSLVGPRPCIPYEYEEYSAQQRHRFAATPGLTGLWQVSGKNRTTFDQMIALDIRYAHEKSLWLDLKIIVMTPIALLQQIGDTFLARPKPTAASPAPVARPAKKRTKIASR